MDHDQYGIGDRINLFVCLFIYEYLYGKKAEVEFLLDHGSGAAGAYFL